MLGEGYFSFLWSHERIPQSTLVYLSQPYYLPSISFLEAFRFNSPHYWKFFPHLPYLSKASVLKNLNKLILTGYFKKLTKG